MRICTVNDDRLNTSLYSSGVRKAVDEYLLKKSKEKRDYGDYWSASSAGYCMRKNIFDRLQVPHVETESDARKQRVFESGHIFHEWIQRLTKEAGLSVAQENELIDDKIMVKGHFDDLVRIDGKLLLIDYKTQNSRAFSYAKPEISHYHRMQLATYMYMLRKGLYNRVEAEAYKVANGEYPVDTTKLDEARLVKISKDDLRMGEQQLHWTPGLEKLVYEYWSTLNSYWKNKRLPKCTCADYEINKKTGIGFMADSRYNPYFYNKEPCSLDWLKKCKGEGKVTW